MTIWQKYSKDQRNEYIKFLQVYGALSNLFRQKKGDPIPYLDSKFQETIYAKIFKCENVDIGNTPHDVLSIFNNERIGIGLKTWMSSKPSFQKVMQIKRYQETINQFRNDEESLVNAISEIKNEKLISDYKRLGLVEDKNIYHYVTRDRGQLIINECSYPLIDINSIKNIDQTKTSLSWSDNHKEYKFTFGDSQIWQKFDSSSHDTFRLKPFNVKIIEDPFSFLIDAYFNSFVNAEETKQDIIEAYLPLYSYNSGEVEEKSGLNSWNAASKSKGSNIPRPLNEIYIPIPRDFHKKNPNFFINDIFKFERDREQFEGYKADRPEIRFHIQLPNGKKIPSLVTQSNMKSLQSGSNTEHDENGQRFGQSALGQWLLVDVLGLKERKLVTREWLEKKGTDSVRLWRKKDDYKTIYIDFAPFGSFEAFMNDEPIPQGDDL